MNETSASPRRWPHWLIVSLMTNMILVGLLAGLLLQSGPKNRPDGRPGERFTWASRDGGDREKIGHVFREAFKASESARQARADVRRRLADAVSADPYDADAVRALFRELRESDDTVNEATHEAMVGLFATLPVEDRRHMARVLTHGPEDRKRMRGPGPNDPAGPPEGPPDDRPPPPSDMEP